MIRLTAVIDLEGHGARALTHESNSKSMVIGRDAQADFQIPLTTISRQHARIHETDSVYVFEDLGSTHGSLLNGKKLTKGEKKVLRDGDVIELTKARITCSIQMDKVVEQDSGESTKMIADKAVQGILGRLGDATTEGPYFRVITGPDEGQRNNLAGSSSEWAMGRSKDCDIVLNDANVSRKHAIVKKDWNGFTIQDLGSKNGVIVNDRKIGKPRRLKDQDEVTIGPIKLIFIDPDADLMAALSDVPGFEQQDEPEPEELEDDPSVMGAPGSGLEDGDELPDLDEQANPEAEGEGEEAEEDEEEFADIDDELLATDESKFPTEWIIVGIVGVIVVFCVLLLVLMLS